MRILQEMDPRERKALLLETVAGSVALEGMDDAAQKCLEEATKIRQERAEATTQGTSPSKNFLSAS